MVGFPFDTSRGMAPSSFPRSGTSNIPRATHYRGRNVVERCFNKLKQWRGIAMRTDKTARSYRAAIHLAATLIWIKTDLVNTS